LANGENLGPYSPGGCLVLTAYRSAPRACVCRRRRRSFPSVGSAGVPLTFVSPLDTRDLRAPLDTTRHPPEHRPLDPLARSEHSARQGDLLPRESLASVAPMHTSARSQVRGRRSLVRCQPVLRCQELLGAGQRLRIRLRAGRRARTGTPVWGFSAIFTRASSTAPATSSSAVSRSLDCAYSAKHLSSSTALPLLGYLTSRAQGRQAEVVAGEGQ